MKPGTLMVLVALAVGAWSCSTPQSPPVPAPWENPTPDSNGIPNLSLVESNVWRGGQPNTAGFAWLKAMGIRDVVKLNEDSEGSDLAGEDLGLTIHKVPIGTMEQLWDGPDPETVSNAVWLVGSARPVFVHCEHGQDRTGLVVGLYRLKEGTNAAAAWGEMIWHGYHPALIGLDKAWSKASGETVSIPGSTGETPVPRLR